MAMTTSRNSLRLMTPSPSASYSVKTLAIRKKRKINIFCNTVIAVRWVKWNPNQPPAESQISHGPFTIVICPAPIHVTAPTLPALNPAFKNIRKIKRRSNKTRTFDVSQMTLFVFCYPCSSPAHIIRHSRERKRFLRLTMACAAAATSKSHAQGFESCETGQETVTLHALFSAQSSFFIALIPRSFWLKDGRPILNRKRIHDNRLAKF